MSIKTISFNTPDSDIFKKIVGVAKTGFFDGRSTTTYFEDCRWFVERYECIIVFTRDIGYHTIGWWKNPDYERCYHLSISFPGGSNNRKLEHILDKFFGNNKRLLWCEPPYSKEGKEAGVYHYRLFCNEKWEPIMPRGEVYSKQFTEIGWKSFSELHQII